MSETDINATVNVTEDIYADVDSTAMSAAVIDDGDSIVVPAEVDFGQTLDTELEDSELIDVPVDENVGMVGDHRVLLHRDASNQHPMSAITGLEDALDEIDTALSDRISQVEAETAELDVDMAGALLRIGDLQDQVDGNITTWFYAAEPAMNLPPVTVDPSNPHDTGWDTDDKKNEHKGDLYYNTITGYAYRFAYSDGAYGWLRITDTDVVKALADAARAQDTADSKRRVFYTTPYPPYDKGDLWVQGGSGDILVCTTDKPADGSYSVSDWSLASKYTDDTVADMALASANGKNTVYHQASQPTGGTYKKGDTWFDTDDDYTMYTYDGSLWIKEQFGNEAIADLSISNAKIKDATIEYGKIKSVDAGKITVGYLNAARIESGSIGVGKIDATSGTFNEANIPNLNANKITAGDISADRMKVNSISAINGNTGTVQIAASKVDIAGAAVFNNYSTTAEMNQAISNAVDAKKSIWTLNTSYSYSYADILRYSADGYQGTWAIDIATTPIVDVKAGDTVRLKVEISDMGSVGNRPSAYIIGTVVTKGADGLGVHSHGLDTTVIDGGNILTNSITANQIAANAITASELDTDNINNSNLLSTGALTVGAQNSVLNSKIQIGGRNLFINGKMSRGVYITNYGGLAGSTRNVTSAFIPVNGGDSVILQNWSNDTSRSDWWAMAFYTAATSDSGTTNDSFIAGSYHSAYFSNGYKMVSYEAPSNAKFVRVSRQFTELDIGSTWNNGDNGNSVKVEIGTNPTDFTLAPEDTKKIHNLSSTYSIPYATARAWAAEGQDAGSWTVSSTSGVDIGDTVRIKCTLSDMNDAVVYIQGTVTNVTSATTLKMISHGLDTTVIDGGMILTGTVAADRIDAANLTIGGSQLSGTVPMARLTSEARKAIQDQGIKILNTPYNNTYSDLIAWSSKSTDTYSINTSETPITNIGAGNTVALRCWDSTHQKYVYILAYVYEVASSTQIKVNPKGFYDPDISSYITKVGSDGIKVFDGINTTNYAQIDSNGTHIYKGGYERAVFGETVRLKSASGFPQVCVDSNEAWFAYSANDWATLNSTGFNIVKNSTSVAFYGDEARVGKQSTRHVEVKDGGMQVYQDSSYVMAHIGYGTTNNGSGTETAPYYTFGHRNSGYANGKYSVCEGYDCAASQADAHAEGMGTKATATAAHSEGSNTTASGSYSHAEGYQTTASGYGAHASGYGTIAQAFGQTAVGRYNVAQGTSNTMVATDNAFIVGNGSSLSSRSNALAVTYQGKMTIAGTLTQGSDRRLKDHISYVGDEAIEFINGLKPAHYIKDGEKHVGFYAQDVKEVDKWDCMTGEMNGYMTLGYMELLAPMVAYIQRLEKRIEELERSK